LQFLRTNHFAGVLADDMGLGKTVQTLAHLQYEKEEGRLNKACLIIAPASLMGNWFDEAQRFTPQLKILIFHGSDRHQVNFDDYDLVLSTYGLVQRDKQRFLDYTFYYLILDEAQFIKNARTKTTQIIQQLHAKHRFCLTGTPVENHLGELWSLFHFLMPGLLGDFKQFRRFFRIPIEKQNDHERREILAHRVQPFMLRRTKNQVARELPAKTEMTHMIELSGPQRDLYEAIRMSMEKKVRDAIARQGLGKSQIILLDALLKLRQVCCDPRLLSIPEASMAHAHSAKLEALMELLDNLVKEGRSVLVFSQFTSMLSLIEAELKARQYEYLKLTGQTKNRQALVRRFQEGEAPVFLISLKAGGTGLNLTRADTVILYDPWWNPSVQDQATDRSHRIGQENPVFVYRLITAGTVEEAILSIQEKKRTLLEGILSNKTEGGIGLTDEDVAQFFAPLEG
jgi:SNF2 family DNA or RNA helicase